MTNLVPVLKLQRVSDLSRVIMFACTINSAKKHADSLNKCANVCASWTYSLLPTALNYSKKAPPFQASSSTEEAMAHHVCS